MRSFSTQNLSGSTTPWWRRLIVGGLCGLLVASVSGTSLIRSIDMALVDFGFQWRGARTVDPSIIIINVDDATIARANEQVGVGLPLPRRYYAQAIDKLTQAGAKTIAFDVLFADESSSGSDDKVLAQAIQRSGRVVLASGFSTTGLTTQGTGAAQIPLNLPAGLPASIIPVTEDKSFGDVNVPNAVRVVPPLPALASGAARIGHFNVFPDSGGELRRLPYLLRYQDKIYPSLALAAVSHFQKFPIERIFAQSQDININGTTIPLDSQGMTPINWIGAPGAHPHWSLNELLEGRVPPDALRDKLVLIGITAIGSYENRATPFTSASPAVEFQANALDNLLSNQPLQVPPDWIRTLLTLTLPLVLSFALTQGLTQISARRRRAALPLLFLAPLLLLPVQLVLIQQDILLPLGAPLLAGLLALALSMGLEWRREWEHNARADSAALALARGALLLSTAARASTRDRLVQILRTTARDTLGAREVVLLFSSEQPIPSLDDATNKLVAEAARAAQSGGVPLLLPNVRFSRAQMASAGVRSLVAAPIPSIQLSAQQNSEGEEVAGLLDSRRVPAWAGAIVALDRGDSMTFSPRDATLLAALAQEAALALENWGFAAVLRGRIEVADRELRSAYHLLAEQNSKLAAAVESIEAAMVVIDPQGNAAFVNPAAARILRGATPILGENVASALHAGDLDALADFIAEAGTTKRSGEVDRESDILSVQCTPLESDNEEFLGMMVVVADVTAQRELDRMKTDFVGYVAHELRSPLSTILGYASLLDYAVGTDPTASIPTGQLQEMTAIIGRHCRRMNRMIGDLLDLARLDSNAPVFTRPVYFDLYALCQNLVEEQRSQLNPLPEIEIALQSSQQPFEVLADTDRMEQILTNLLSNAVKYSPDGGCITVTLNRTEAGFVMEVSDEGLGLTEEQLHHLFGKFYRTSDARTLGIKGTGLGLNLVKQLVEAHGGTIEALSDRDRGGKGTTFRIAIPQKPYDPANEITSLRRQLPSEASH